MSADRFHVVATNDVTSVLIVKKYTLEAAVLFACSLLDTWTDVHVREYPDNVDSINEKTVDANVFKVVAKLSNQGMMF